MKKDPKCNNGRHRFVTLVRKKAARYGRGEKHPEMLLYINKPIRESLDLPDAKFINMYYKEDPPCLLLQPTHDPQPLLSVSFKEHKVVGIPRKYQDFVARHVRPRAARCVPRMDGGNLLIELKQFEAV
jgi:hypothetical protein